MKSKEDIQNILIADDSGMARMIIQQCLEIAGFKASRFLEAKHGQQALEVLENTAVDLLVTDLNMPIMNGKTLVEKIRKNANLDHMIIVVITSVTNPAKEQELKVAGADAVMGKPVSPTAIVRLWKQLSESNQGGE